MTETPAQIFPRSVLSASRQEFGHLEDNPSATHPPLKLLVKDGKELPPDLPGHLFIVAPVGSIDSPSIEGTQIIFPSDDGATPIYNGDGMIYRIDFNNLAEGVTLTSRLLKTPCYYADVATHKCQQYQQPTDLSFQNLGILRFSNELGSRNQLNTGFLPMKFSEAEGYRLLATWDMGRPYEIDTQTLEAVTPVGGNREWRPMNPLLAKLPFQPPFPFPLVQSSAHPCFDFNTKEMFTVNVGRSLSIYISQLRPVLHRLLDIINIFDEPGFHDLLIEQLPISDEQVGKKQVLKQSIFENIFSSFQGLIKSSSELLGLFEFFHSFVYIIRWDGINPLQKWEVVLPNGEPVKVSQSIHQIGLTEDYIVLVDTAFKTLIEELIPGVKQKQYESAENFLRNLIDFPQLTDTYLYIVRRDELKPNQKQVQAKKLVIPRETTHFTLDYKNPDNQITIHLSHLCAWDVAEWIRDIDKSIFEANNEIPKNIKRLFGVLVSPMDISRLGCYVIDLRLENARVLKSDLSELYQDPANKDSQEQNYSPNTWGPSLFTCLENQSGERIEDIYWTCLGCWPELLTEHSLELYRDYKYREVPVKDVIKMTQQGIKPNLLRLHIHPIDSLSADQNRLEIQDIYEFPDRHFGTSPQFIPRVGGNGKATAGYIACIVYYGAGDEPDNGNEIWIFDAANLKAGPVCQLWHPQLNLAFTVHTTWLPQIAKRTARYNVPVQEDYQDLVEQQPQQIKDLFRNWIYRKQEPN